MSKLRVAIVGCGGIANQKHMPSIKANADKADMVAFCDITVSYTHLDVYKRQILLSGYCSDCIDGR